MSNSEKTPNRLLGQLEALQNDVQELTLQFQSAGMNEEQDDNSGQEEDSTSQTEEAESSEHHPTNAALLGTTETWRDNLDLINNLSSTAIEILPSQQLPPAQVLPLLFDSKEGQVESIAICPTISEQTVQLVADLAKTNRQLRQERDNYKLKVIEEQSKVNELASKFMALFQATERSNDMLRAALNSKEDVCRRQSELIRSSLKMMGNESTFYPHQTITTTSKQVNMNCATFQNLPVPSPPVIDNHYDNESHAQSDQVVEKKRGGKAKRKNRRRRSPAKSRQTIFS